MTENKLVLLTVADGIATLSFNRPEAHNAISNDVRRQFSAALDQVARNREARVLVLRGEGKSFCSGIDTSQLGARRQGEGHGSRIRRSQGVRQKQANLSIPTIGVLKGHVIGGGAEIALATDVRIASTDLRISLPEVKYGLVVDTGGSVRLPQLVGPARAKWLLMSGDVIDARQALEWGLIDWIAQPEELDQAALELARKLAANPPRAVAASKRLIDALYEDDISNSLEREVQAQCDLYEGEEYAKLKSARIRGS